MSMYWAAPRELYVLDTNAIYYLGSRDRMPHGMFRRMMEAAASRGFVCAYTPLAVYEVCSALNDSVEGFRALRLAARRLFRLKACALPDPEVRLSELLGEVLAGVGAVAVGRP